MKRKKILHLISGLEIGGSETQLLRILPKLQQYHENTVCCVRGHGPIGSELEKNGVPVYYLDFKGVSDFFVIKRFYLIVKKIDPEILVTYLIHADLYGRFFGKLFGIKKIISSKRGALLQWEWLAFFDRLTKFMVNHYLVQTKTAKNEWVDRLKLPGNKFTIIPNGIDTRLFSLNLDKLSKRTEIGVAADSLIITCVARLRMGKGHKTLLSAFEEVSKKYPTAELLLVGDGEKEIELRKQITSYTSKNNIHFLGNREDVSEILTISDIFVLATEAEGMSNAIMEAMATGLPIITTDIPENQDILNNRETGVLFQSKNSQQLAESITLLFENLPMRNKLGQAAKIKAVNEFDIKKVTFRYATFFEII